MKANAKTDKTEIIIDSEDYESALAILDSLRESIFKLEEDTSWTIEKFRVLVTRDYGKMMREKFDFSEVVQEINIEKLEEKAKNLDLTFDDFLKGWGERSVALPACFLKLGYIPIQLGTCCFLVEDGKEGSPSLQHIEFSESSTYMPMIKDYLPKMKEIQGLTYLPLECLVNLFLLRKQMTYSLTNSKKEIEERIGRLKTKSLGSTHPSDMYALLMVNTPWKFEKDERPYEVPVDMGKWYESFEGCLMKYLKKSSLSEYQWPVHWIMPNYSRFLLPKIEGKQLLVGFCGGQALTKDWTVQNFGSLPTYPSWLNYVNYDPKS
jgi:hypothetical protein